MPDVNPQNLQWARESAGLTLSEAARAIGLRGVRAIERLSDLEAGRCTPTRPQLIAMAKAYRRSLLAFYVAHPPRSGARNHDFRAPREQDAGAEATLNALVRDVHVRQALLRSALEENEDAEVLDFVGSIPASASAQQIADAMKRLLGIELQQYRAARTAEDAFAVLRTAVERVGIYVLLMGNLGSFHTDLSPYEVFRGLSIADNVAPFIVVNETDAKSSWGFTLLHELGHVLLGQSDISGYGGTDRFERMCDQAAALYLIPPADLRQLPIDDAPDFEELVSVIGNAAARWKVSRLMVAYNLLQARRIDNLTYAQLDNRFSAERAAQRQRRDDASGPSYYVVRRHRLGHSLMQTVDRLLDAGVLTTSKAGRILRVKPTNIEPLLAAQSA